MACSFVRSPASTKPTSTAIQGLANIGVRGSRGCTDPRCEQVRGESGIRAKLPAKSARNCKQQLARWPPSANYSRIPQTCARSCEFSAQPSISLSCDRVALAALNSMPSAPGDGRNGPTRCLRSLDPGVKLGSSVTRTSATSPLLRGQR